MCFGKYFDDFGYPFDQEPCPAESFYRSSLGVPSFGAGFFSPFGFRAFWLLLFFPFSFVEGFRYGRLLSTGSFAALIGTGREGLAPNPR